MPDDSEDIWRLFTGVGDSFFGESDSNDPIERLGNMPDPSQYLENAEIAALVESKIDEMPQDWRRSFRLHFSDGFEVPAISRMLSLSEEQVEFRLRGAAEFLRDHLDDLRPV
jgi:DNA-directed RNA polymerase specialized sigma24 family protein